MGFFDSFLNKNKNNNTSNTIQSTKRDKAIEGINLRKDTVKISLQKNNLQNTKAKVEFVLDDSLSFDREYNNGNIQKITERIMSLALEFDDDGNMPVTAFGNTMKTLEEASLNNFHNYVEENIIKASRCDRYGTNYAQVIQSLTRKYKNLKSSDDPVFVVFITDGDCGDKSKTDRVLIEASKYKIFFKFIGVGNSSFRYLESLDNGIKERYVDNANFQKINSINDLDDKQLYEMLLEEFSEFLNVYDRKFN